MGTGDKHRDHLRILGLISIVYGLVYSIIDRIDYMVQVEKYKSILSQAYPESIMLRIPNLIFCLILIIAGYFLIHKRKESWYLFNIAFSGILFKYLYIFILVPPFAFGNILSTLGFHLVFAIIGLIYINRKKFKANFDIRHKNFLLTYLYLFLLSVGIVFFYGFEDLTGYGVSNKKHYEELVHESNSYIYSQPDTCYFARDFIEIIDTLSGIEDYTSIMILQIDSNSVPKYAEKLSLFESKVISEYYKYDIGKQILTRIKERNSFSDLYDTLSFNYQYKNSLTELPKKDLPDDWYLETDLSDGKDGQVIKIVRIYISNSKKLIEKELTVFTKRRKIQPNTVYSKLDR